MFWTLIIQRCLGIFHSADCVGRRKCESLFKRPRQHWVSLINKAMWLLSLFFFFHDEMYFVKKQINLCNHHLEIIYKQTFYRWGNCRATVSEQAARRARTELTLLLFFLKLFRDTLWIELACRWSMDCVFLNKIALAWMYLLSDASTAFTTLTDGCSPIAWRNIVVSELL